MTSKVKQLIVAVIIAINLTGRCVDAVDDIDFKELTKCYSKGSSQSATDPNYRFKALSQVVQREIHLDSLPLPTKVLTNAVMVLEYLAPNQKKR